MSIISVNNLHKQFRVTAHKRGITGTLRAFLAPKVNLINAVDQISFDIGAGELVGYLGPNGAGKSTTIKMLAGLLVPTAGDLQVNGRIPWKQRRTHVAQIGAVFGQRTTLWWDLPVIESLDLLQHIYRIPAGRFRHNLAQFTDLLELEPFLDAPVRTLSLGQRMRADLCAALMHDPADLFLDEPTIGLDVVAKERIRQFIRRVNRERGTTVILTTRDLQDVEKLCERVLIIDHGRLLFDGRLADLRDRFGGKRELRVDFVERYEEVSVEGAETVARDGLRTTYRFERNSVTASELIGRLSERFRIRDLEVRESDIEETIRRIYEKRLLHG
jgi:ABC-2 type transport system ATP-binding protein